MNKLIVLRVFFLGTGCLFFLWFLWPWFTHRIMNIGNETGILLSVILILIGIFWKKIGKILCHIQSATSGKVLLGAMIAVGIFVCILVLTESICMIYAASQKEENPDVVIVLGCKVYGEKPSLMLEERLDAAAKYLQKNSSVLCILSGGKGADENISEAECMYRYLLKKGIKKDRLIMEDQSTSTRENILFSQNIMKEKKLGNHIILVTNEFHQYRASRIAHKNNLQVGAISGKTAYWLFPTYYVRELYGILYEWISH